jgi:hypothetical protein
VSTKLIELEDGILVEVQTQEDGFEALSSRTADRVGATIDSIGPLIVKLCSPIGSALKDLKGLGEIDHVEVALSLGFEVEGNMYVARSKADANVSITFSITPEHGQRNEA